MQGIRNHAQEVLLPLGPLWMHPLWLSFHHYVMLVSISLLLLLLVSSSLYHVYVIV